MTLHILILSHILTNLPGSYKQELTERTLSLRSAPLTSFTHLFMKHKLDLLIALACAGLLSSAFAADTTTAPKESVFHAKPLGITLSIKMVGPYTEPADLLIICLFKHKQAGDTYQGAAKETDEHLRGLLSSLRNRGEFAGELGETFLFTPPKD